MRLLLALLCISPILGHQALRSEEEGWIVAHQDEDGKWDADGFFEHDPPGERLGTPGRADFDVGVTGLAALLVSQHKKTRGSYLRAADWLGARQDPRTGLVGSPESRMYRYQHALATLALCEGRPFEIPARRDAARKAKEHIEAARGPQGAWGDRPGEPANSFLTGWMLYALIAARGAGLEVDEEVITGGWAWIERHTDPETGHVAFGAKDTPDPLGLGRGEILTAQALMLRDLLEGPCRKDPIATLQIERITSAPLRSDGDGFQSDPLYWFFGTLAVFRMGGKSWKLWDTAMKEAVLADVNRPTELSWTRQSGAWGPVGGSVYTNVMGMLCLAVHFRYATFPGAR